MIRRFVNWYIRNYMKGDFFSKDELNDAFENIRKSEAEIHKAHFEHEIDILRNTLQRKNFVDTTELRNEIKALMEELEFYKNRQRSVDQLEFSVLKKAQECVSLVTGASMRVNMLRDTFADHSGTMEKVKTEMENVYLELGGQAYGRK